MAYSRRLEQPKLRAVRRQLGHLIVNFHRHVVDVESTEVHETFELCMIQGDAFPLAKGERLSTVVRRTGGWQHLVKSNGRPVGIAHSAAPGPLESSWSVQSFFVTPISVKIARAVAKIDKMRAAEDIEVTLVTVPSKQVDFFLLQSPNKTEVFLIVARDKSTGLIEGRFYSETRFLNLLSSAPNIMGFHGIGPVSDPVSAQNAESRQGKTKTRSRPARRPRNSKDN
jgi:hypothetical protein